jgi:hypothetical protein
MINSNFIDTKWNTTTSFNDFKSKATIELNLNIVIDSTGKLHIEQEYTDCNHPTQYTTTHRKKISVLDSV